MINKRLIQIIGALIVYIPTFFLSEGTPLQLSLYVISYLIAGGSVLLNAIRNMRPGSFFDESFLMSIATIGAFYIREYPEAIAVMLFYQIGEYFQDYAVNKSKRSITGLMELRADYANLKINGDIVKVEPEEVVVGSLIVVKAGERIPLDGVISEGTSFIDTSALTGEAIPAEVGIGSEILSGCVNLNGLLVVRTTNSYGESTVSRILELVENASGKKSSQEKFITRFARYYTPIVVIIGVMLATIPPFVLGLGTFDTWLYRALAFLVVSCPCALVVSIPLSFFAGIGAASKEGILVKGGSYLEALAKVDTVIFDKTGTLTKGVFEVENIVTFNDVERDELLEMAAYSESHSSHPISDSLKRAYGAEIIDKRIGDVQEIPGLGIIAYVDGRKVVIGNRKLMDQEALSIDISNDEVLGTVVHIGIDGIYGGYITIADEIKTDTLATIKELRKLGVTKIVMLTGDSNKAAMKVAAELGIDEYYGELMPGDKLDKLEDILNGEGKGKVIFVGDGINDAPVLARADIGIAMGGLGRDAAIEAADVVIMQDEPIKVVTAIKLGRRIVGIATANIVMALGIKGIVLVLSALGYASLWMAVFADVGVTVLAVFNSLRALKRKG
ncbi:MAG: heavy metal-translocating P-type ATPase [Fusobacteria bacterium]|nr:MAG: heavy metal-translocating P-type ATPase [Fusobacteriota bacterium]KAF0229277.1 MAG: heavy metal-translocating P-type [Fusobacteriota bacterium]